MQTFESILTNKSGVFPDCLAIDSTGAATPDGTEFIASFINNWTMGASQSIMDYSAGSANAPTGAVGVPNGVTEAAGVSQIVEALHKMTGSGPGTVKPWMKEDNPATTGDRVLLLAEQGVLIASYPDLDAATWITGNTAAQIAAAAAGQKFYRSSDAGGATGDAAGPYLQLPANLQPTFLKQYNKTDVVITTSSPALSSVTFSNFVPYKTSDTTWRLRFNINVIVTGSSRTTTTVTVPGVSFLSPLQSCSGMLNANLLIHQKYATGSGVLTMNHATSTATDITMSGDVGLNLKPTWADDFEIQWGITY